MIVKPGPWCKQGLLYHASASTVVLWIYLLMTSSFI